MRRCVRAGFSGLSRLDLRGVDEAAADEAPDRDLGGTERGRCIKLIGVGCYDWVRECVRNDFESWGY